MILLQEHRRSTSGSELEKLSLVPRLTKRIAITDEVVNTSKKETERVTLNPILLQRHMSTSNIRAGINPTFFVDKKQNPLYRKEKQKRELDLALEKKRTEEEERRREDVLRSREIDALMLRTSGSATSQQQEEGPRSPPSATSSPSSPSSSSPSPSSSSPSPSPAKKGASLPLPTKKPQGGGDGKPQSRKRTHTASNTKLQPSETPQPLSARTAPPPQKPLPKIPSSSSISSSPPPSLSSSPPSTPFWLHTYDSKQITDWLFGDYTGDAFANFVWPKGEIHYQPQVIDTVHSLFTSSADEEDGEWEEKKEREKQDETEEKEENEQENENEKMHEKEEIETGKEKEEEKETEGAAFSDMAIGVMTVLGQYQILLRPPPVTPTTTDGSGIRADIYDVEELVEMCFPSHAVLPEWVPPREKEKDKEEEKDKTTEKEQEKAITQKETQQEEETRPKAEEHEATDDKAKEGTPVSPAPAVVVPPLQRRVPHITAPPTTVKEGPVGRRRGMTHGNLPPPVYMHAQIDDIFQEFKPPVRRTQSDGHMHSWDYSLNASHTTPRHPYKGSSSPSDSLLPSPRSRRIFPTLLDRALGDGRRNSSFSSSSSASSHSSFSEADSDNHSAREGDDSDAGRGYSFGEEETEEEIQPVDLIQSLRAIPPDLEEDMQGQILFSSSKDILKATVDALIWVLISKDGQGIDYSLGAFLQPLTLAFAFCDRKQSLCRYLLDDTSLFYRLYSATEETKGEVRVACNSIFNKTIYICLPHQDTQGEVRKRRSPKAKKDLPQNICSSDCGTHPSFFFSRSAHLILMIVIAHF